MTTTKTSFSNKSSFWQRLIGDYQSIHLASLLPLLLIAISALGVSLPTTLPLQGRLTIFAFLLAAILWSTTSINAGYVALASVLFLVLTGGISQAELYGAFSSHIIWLMIGAYILGGAVDKSGLSARLTQMVVGRSRTVGSLFWSLTTILIPLTFLIPSTSGRAAVTIPIFRSVAAVTDDKRTIRALAMLIPTVILVSTIVSLVGAGSHLVANELLEQISGQYISFTQWVVYGLPFGVAASYISCWVIMKMFVNKRRLHQKLPIKQLPQAPLSLPERKTIGIVLLMIALWLSESWHGWEIATVSIIGAMLLTIPRWGVMKWKDGVKAISWNLIVFVGAALVLGHSLIDSGAAQWIIDRVFKLSNIASTESNLVLLLLLAVISLSSHIYMTSHTARAAALVPPLLYLASSLQLNPVAVLFLSTLGMDYCLTFPVSSKALLVYQEMDEESYRPKDLLNLSVVLILVHLALIFLFYYTYWHWVGLSL
ncbi:MAG: SLC13 family permease [Xenococcaceae cyanobacterium MO_167.B52]|nr:SLC13 family permease [Xenococcaceae cyanobacterium MO_167.B52]